MNKIEMEVVRFNNADVIATSTTGLYQGAYFATKSEWNQDPNNAGDVILTYFVAFQYDGGSVVQDGLANSAAKYDDRLYAWYDVDGNQWLTDGRTGSTYYNTDTGMYNFPTD